MARIDNVNESELSRLIERVRKLETASPIGDSSVSQGALEIRSAEGLIVDGSSRVAGTLSVTGTQTVGGTLSVTGTETVSGTLNVTGVENVAGTLNIDGLLLVDGAAGLNGTLGINGNATIGAGGTLTVGGMVLDPNVSGFGGIRSTGTIYLSAPGVVTTGQITGGSIIIIGSSMSVTSLPTTTNAPNLYVDGTGQFFRCI